jgi:hypothetical protein
MNLVKGHVVQSQKQLSTQQGLRQDIIAVKSGYKGAGTL